MLTATVLRNQKIGPERLISVPYWYLLYVHFCMVILLDNKFCLKYSDLLELSMVIHKCYFWQTSKDNLW